MVRMGKNKMTTTTFLRYVKLENERDSYSDVGMLFEKYTLIDDELIEWNDNNDILNYAIVGERDIFCSLTNDDVRELFKEKSFRKSGDVISIIDEEEYKWLKIK